MVSGRRCNGVFCMTEIVLKDITSVYLLKNCKAIVLRSKIKICYPNDILNLNACICSSKISICKITVAVSLIQMLNFLFITYTFSDPYVWIFFFLILEKVRYTFTFKRLRNSMSDYPLLRKQGDVCITSYSFCRSGFHNLLR